MTARHRLVRVPASSANLGPGYDVMAAALDLFLELEVEETGEFGFDPGGLEVPSGRENLIVRAFETLHSADGIAFRLKRAIPLGRGLGSSAAAIVAGLVAADHLYELALSREELLARASEIEGHPDNVAAAIYGGFVVCDRDSDGAPRAARFDPPNGLEGILVVPDEEVPTERAREAIPAEVPLADAVANVAAASRLVLGLQSADLDLLASGLVDRIHQPRRRGALSALDGAGRGGRRPRRARRDDLRRRPDRPRLDHLAGRRQGQRRAGGPLRGLGRGPPRPLHPARRRRAGAVSRPERLACAAAR